MSSSPIEPRHLRSAVEFALLMAQEGQKFKPPLAYPASLKRHFGSSRLAASSLPGLVRAIDGDDSFRRKIAVGAVPELVDEIGRLWLERPDGWADRAAELAAECDREIEDDHFGVLIPYSPTGELPETLVRSLAERRPDLDPSSLLPRDWGELQRLIRQFVDVGTTKFVVLPMDEPHTTDEWTAHLEEAAEALLPLEN